MKEKVIAIVGMTGAGKSEAAAYFQSRNIPVLRFGDQTDIGLREQGKKLSEENERIYREQLRNELGMAAYAIKIYERLQTLNNPKLTVFDGLYSWEEYTFLRGRIDILLLHIYASPNIRYSRLENRKVRPLTCDEARSRDIAEIENLNKGGPIAIADHLIINETTIKSLHTHLDTFLQHIL